MITFISENREDSFAAVKRLDLANGVVSLLNIAGGGYSTVLPISPADYRKERPTRARAFYSLNKGVHRFLLSDDWGTEHVLILPDDETNRAIALDQVERLKAANLLEGSQPADAINERQIVASSST